MTQDEIDKAAEGRYVISEAGCWIWQGKKNHKGYGYVSVCGNTIGAHRLSFLLHRGPIPKGLEVMHTCDIPACINPEHLMLGTTKDNARDCVRKGRKPFQKNRELARRCREVQIGEKNSFSRLSEDDIIQIRQYSLSGLSQRQIAARFGVTQTNIGYILRGETWKSVPLPSAPEAESK